MQSVKTRSPLFASYALTSELFCRFTQAELPAAPKETAQNRSRDSADRFPVLPYRHADRRWRSGWLGPVKNVNRQCGPAACQLHCLALSIVFLPFGNLSDDRRAAIFRGRRHRRPDARSVADRRQFRDLTQYGRSL